MNSRKRKGQLESMIGKIFVLSLFLILLVNLIVPNKEKSEEENRMLETKPKASAASIISGDYMEQWEKYVSDQFFGWLSALGKRVKIVSPENVRREYRDFLKRALENYEG